jgi:hypothetical protein
MGGGPLNMTAPPDPYPPAVLLSAQFPNGQFQNTAHPGTWFQNTPFLPFGYDMFRRIGWTQTSNASPVALINFYMIGVDQVKRYYYDSAIQILNITATAPKTALTLTNSINLGTGVAACPPINTQVYVDVAMTQTAANQYVAFLPWNSANTAALILTSGGSTASEQWATFAIPAFVDVATGLAKIYYFSTAGTLTAVYVNGFEDYLGS